MFHDLYRHKRVFLTGHTGFKGAWLAEWLLALGAEVHGYALDPEPGAVLYDQLGLSGRLASDTRADLADRQLVSQRILEIRPHFVFHLAAQALVRLSYEVPVETFATNVMGTAHVLDALRQLQQTTSNQQPATGHRCVAVMVTTDKCYENREWLHAYREEDPMGGHDPYSASKGAAEIVIASYRKSFFGQGTGDRRQGTGDRGQGSTIPLASARAGNVIGGGDWAKDRIVPDSIRALRHGEPVPVRNKTATRPWQHVLEPLSGYLWLAASLSSDSCLLSPVPCPLSPLSGPLSPVPCPLASAFNFGPNLTSNRTVAELVQELLKHTGGEWLDAGDPNAPHEASKLNLATEKAFHLLGWQPTWNFETTLKRTAEWYLGEAKGEDVRALTLAQIQEYTHDAASNGIAWAKS